MISAPQATNTPVVADPSYTATKSSEALEDAQKTAATSSQGQQNLRNSQILQASLQVSIQAGSDSLALLYRTAVDEINNVLAPDLGPDAIHNAMSQDNSAQATAGRIVGLSTVMFNAYAARYPDKDMEVVAKDFVNVVRGGFEQGYKEAEDILNSLGVLSAGSPVAEGISQTFALVQKGYDDWLANKLASLRIDQAQGSAAPQA